MAGSKIDLSSNPEFITEHDSSTFVHSTTSSSFRRLRVTPNVSGAATEIDQVDVDAEVVSLLSLTGTSRLLTTSTTTGVAVVDFTVSLAANGPLGIDNGADDGRENSTIYYIWLVADSSGTDTPDLTCVFSKEATASATFINNINDHVMTGGAADFALLVGAVFNDANDRIRELPRTISGGSNGHLFAPTYSLCAHGSYSGDGVDSRWIDVGFEPDVVIIKGDTGVAPVYRTDSHVGDDSSFFTAVANTTNLIQEFGWDGTNNWGFQVGDETNVNLTGGTTTYYWSAWRNHNVLAPSF